MIRFERVSKFYDKQGALRNVSLSIEKGEMTFITGHSGAGKTTLLRLIYASDRPDEGFLTINGVETGDLPEGDIPLLRREIGVVFQDFRLLPNKNVFDNIALALRIRGIPEIDIKPLVHETLRMVNLRHKAGSWPLTLSGGEQQRVVIARAIVGEPQILLADEPTGNLDHETAQGIMRIFREINARGTSILIATHNRELYENTGKRVFVLRDGCLVGDQPSGGGGGSTSSHGNIYSSHHPAGGGGPYYGQQQPPPQRRRPA